jgi:hypothetical protein
MVTRARSEKSLIRILFGVLLVGCLIAGVAIAGALYWVKSFVGPTVGNAQVRPILMAKNEVVPPFQIPATYKKNAILDGKQTKQFAGDDIFKDLEIPRIQILLESAELSKLKSNPREYVRATVREGDQEYTNVAVRLKGSAGSYRDINDRPSFTVNFDKFVEGQKFHGLKKIHLNSSVQDQSLLEEKISREIFEAAGVPAPRAGHAQVTFNKRLLGLYVLIEGVNKQFLKRHFDDTSGNVYEGKSGAEIPNMPTNSGDDRRDKSRLRALATSARQADLSQRLESLKETLDIDRFRIFHDRTSDRMVFIPQGMDQTFNNPDKSIMPQQPVGLVAQAVIQVPELRERYRARVAEIATNVFHYEAISSRIYEVSLKVQEALNEIDSGAAAAHAQQASSLRNRVRRRAEYLERFVSPPATVEFDEMGFALLKGWKAQKDLGEASFNQETAENGSSILRIATKDGCTASWRTVVKLPPGRYALESHIKTFGVVLDPADPRAGAGLRISRHREGQKNSGDNDWMAASFEFEITSEKPEVELVCELRADAGEIWYDVESLKLRRL